MITTSFEGDELDDDELDVDKLCDLVELDAANADAGVWCNVRSGSMQSAFRTPHIEPHPERGQQ